MSKCQDPFWDPVTSAMNLICLYLEGSHFNETGNREKCKHFDGPLKAHSESIHHVPQEKCILTGVSIMASYQSNFQSEIKVLILHSTSY